MRCTICAFPDGSARIATGTRVIANSASAAHVTVRTVNTPNAIRQIMRELARSAIPASTSPQGGAFPNLAAAALWRNTRSATGTFIIHFQGKWIRT
jgi:hypothetical protein